MQFKELYSNFDGLDMAFHGTIPAAVCRQLEEAKSAAQAARADVLATAGALECHVAETGGRGGFAYRLDTGPDGETWWLKSGDKPGWNARVSVHAGAFLQHGGLDAIAERLRARLDALGFKEAASPEGNAEAVSRIDFAMDFLAPGLALDPRDFVAKAGKQAHPGGDDEEAFAGSFWAGQRCTGVTVGKMPGRQIVVYDKTRDSRVKRKGEWFKAWGLDPADKEARVWRVELRAGKKHLREHWGLRTLKQVQEAVGDMFAEALCKVRYCLRDDPRPARRSNHPLWNQALACVQRGLAECFVGLAPGVVREVTRDHASNAIRALMRGLAMTYAAIVEPEIRADARAQTAPGKEPPPVLELVPGRIAADLTRWVLTSPDEGVEKIDRARRRYRFVSPVEYRERKFYAGLGRVAGVG